MDGSRHQLVGVVVFVSSHIVVFYLHYFLTGDNVP